MQTRRLLAPAALLALAFLGTAPAAAPAEDALEKQLLKLNDVTGSDPIEGQIDALAADPAKAKKLAKLAVDMLKDKDAALEYNALYILARAAQKVKDYDSAQELYKGAADRAGKLQSAFRLVQIYDDLYTLYSDNKQYDKAVSICQEILSLKGNKDFEALKPFVVERLVQAMARDGKIDEALKQADKLIELDEGGWYFVQLKGWVLREAGKTDEAVKVYNETVEKIEKSERLKEDQKERYAERVRYLMSGLYVELKDIDKAAEQLQILLKKKPDDPTFNNDLGFIWADHDMNLEESEKLIRKAIEADRKSRKEDPDLDPADDKDNPAYLDSLGWVLYKRKKYADAKKALVEAVKDKEGQHIEILDHLADVHMALGEKDEAIKVWKQALELENLSKREKERRKIVEKKLADAAK